MQHTCGRPDACAVSKVGISVAQNKEARPHHEERVADPETAPAIRAHGDGDVLAVDGDGH